MHLLGDLIELDSSSQSLLDLRNQSVHKDVFLLMRSIKLTVLLCLCSLCSLSFADYFYVGGNVQDRHLNTRSELTYPVSSSSPKQAQYQQALHSLGLGSSIGFVHSFKQSRWALDTSFNLAYHFGDSKQSITPWYPGTNASVKFSSPLQTDLIIAARYQWQPQLSLLAGPEFAYTQFKSESGSSGGDLGATGDFSHNSMGYGFSLGANLKLNQQLSIRLLDNYVYYRAFSFTGLEPVSQSQLRQRYTPSSNQLQLALLVTL